MENSILSTSSQHIKDLKLAIEFKYLTQSAPAGVYLMPEVDSIRHLHGVIFVRRGLYRDGIFRFHVRLPPDYNSINTHPEIVFTPPIFNPLVDPSTGKLDLRQDPALAEWDPSRHYILTALTFLKKSFYMKSYDAFETVSNPEALRMFQIDKEGYFSKVTVEVQASLKRSLTNEISPSCTLIFTGHKPAHDNILKQICNSAAAQTAAAAAAGTPGGSSSRGVSSGLNDSLEASFESFLRADSSTNTSAASSPVRIGNMLDGISLEGVSSPDRPAH